MSQLITSSARGQRPALVPGPLLFLFSPPCSGSRRRSAATGCVFNLPGFNTQRRRGFCGRGRGLDQEYRAMHRPERPAYGRARARVRNAIDPPPPVLGAIVRALWGRVSHRVISARDESEGHLGISSGGGAAVSLPAPAPSPFPATLTAGGRPPRPSCLRAAVALEPAAPDL